MKPENNLVIKRNAFSFSALLALVSILIGSTSWSFLGRRIAERQILIDTLAEDTIRLLKVVVAKDDTIWTQEDTIAALRERLANATSTSLVDEMESIRLVVQEAARHAARGTTLQRFVNIKGNLSGLPENASVKSVELMNECIITLGMLADELAQLQADAAGGIGDGGGGGGTPEKPVATTTAAQTDVLKTEADKRIKAIKQKAVETLKKMDLQNSDGIDRRYFRTAIGWNDTRLRLLLEGYKELVKSIEETPGG